MMLNALEALRVILSFVLFFGALFAVVNADYGLLMLPRAIRNRIKHRRLVTMAGFTIISIVLGLQSVFASQSVNDPNPSLLTITNNLSVISGLLVLIILVAYNVYGWWREGMIVKVPFSPEAEERADEAIKRAREIAHVAKSSLGVIILTLEEVENSTTTEPHVREAAKLSMEHIYALINHIDNLHSEIKMLTPLITGESEDDVTK